MFYAALAVNAVIAVAYLAIFWTILRQVLLVQDQWRSNPLAVATAGIFFSCGIGHALHAVHLVEQGPAGTLLFDTHLVVWDLTTAAVASWYWTLRSGLSALAGSGQLFQDATTEERARLASVLHELFDGLELLPAGVPRVLELPPGLAVARPDDAAVLRDAVREVALDGAPRSLEVRAAGDRVVEVRASRWTDQVVLAWRDVTDLREAQRRQAAVEAQLAAAFDAAPVAMAVLNGTDIARGNRALHRLSGGAPVVGRAFADLFEPEDRGPARERLDALLGGRPSPSWEARLAQAGGEGRWAEVSLAPVHDDVAGAPQVVVHLVDVQERKAYEARLRHIADHDPLTGLVNRRRFDQELRRQCARSVRGERGGALLLLDLDHFKEVNDSLGHAVGDQLIMSVAGVLRREVRECDVVARLGGDEFAVLCTDADRDEALALAARLVQAVRLHTRGLSDSTIATGRVTCSLGLTLFAEHHTPESVLMAADLTLYDAKEDGRDRFAVYSDDQHGQPRTKSRMEWLDRLRVAIDTDGLVVVAQPVVDLTTREVDHVELLLRLPETDGGTVPPSRFLYMAEQSDLICDVDLRMVAFAVEHARRHPGLGVCVNVSGRSLSVPDVLSQLEATVRAAALPPGDLVLEVTETAAVANIHTAREGLLRLQAAGCRIALDDFGAGFGSLAYVKHLPFDILKIDGQFVAGCSSDVTDLVVVDAVVSLARGLGKTVIAEHVGDEATAALLLAHGVDHAQGYFLGRPAVVKPALPRPRVSLEPERDPAHRV